MIKGKLFLVIVVILAYSCAYNQNILRIRVSLITPIKIVEGAGIIDTIPVYINYLKGYTVYELSVRETLEDEYNLIYDSLKFEYYVFNNKKSYGYLLKNLSDTFGSPIKRDSILPRRGFDEGRGDANIDTQPGVISVKKVKDSVGILINRYIFDSEKYDSVYICFDKKLVDVPFSFSKIQDAKYQSKMYAGYVFLKHEKNYDLNSKLNGFFINRFEMTRVPVENERELLKLIARLKKKENTER